MPPKDFPLLAKRRSRGKENKREKRRRRWIPTSLIRNQGLLFLDRRCKTKFKLLPLSKVDLDIIAINFTEIAYKFLNWVFFKKNLNMRLGYENSKE